jgi:xanthosine utilization system XapX-like protein
MPLGAQCLPVTLATTVLLCLTGISISGARLCKIAWEIIAGTQHAVSWVLAVIQLV